MAIPLSNLILLPFKQTCIFDTSLRPNKLFFSTQKTIQPTQKSLRPPLLTPRVSTTDGPQTQPTQEVKDEDEQQAQPSKLPVADHWRQIHGQDNWRNLLYPFDPLLRSELIRYGELAQACYDAFDYDPYSENCGSCRFIRPEFFQRLGMEDFGYDVSRYLYATSNVNLPNFSKKPLADKVWSEKANWIGYVSISNDEMSERIGRRDICIAWRGTVTKLEWIADLTTSLRPVSSNQIPCPDPDVKVESGFLDLYTDKDKNCRFCKYSAREQILTEVRRIIHMYPNEELSITITGHSLGAAMAVLSAYDIVETGLNKKDDGRDIPVSVLSFSGPRVGNVSFKERLEGLGVKVLRVVNVHDIVPKVPGLLLNEHVPDLLRKIVEGLTGLYEHVGVELALDHKISPFLKDTGDEACFHNLEAHLHLLDGYHGSDLKFDPATGRDPALVNKDADFLKDNYLVPPAWKQPENKGMIRNKDGKWILPENLNHDDHPHDIHDYLTQLGLVSDN